VIGYDQYFKVKELVMNHSYFARRRGFVLLDALIAVIVVGVGLLGVAKLNSVMLASTGIAKTRAEATQLAEENLRKSVFSNLLLLNRLPVIHLSKFLPPILKQMPISDDPGPSEPQGLRDWILMQLLFVAHVRNILLALGLSRKKLAAFLASWTTPSDKSKKTLSSSS
jgi:hypothetical protein